MKGFKLATVFLIAGMLLLAGGQAAHAAIKIVKFTVPSCE
jgi:hypothetical protein